MVRSIYRKLSYCKSDTEMHASSAAPANWNCRVARSFVILKNDVFFERIGDGIASFIRKNFKYLLVSSNCTALHGSLIELSAKQDIQTIWGGVKVWRFIELHFPTKYPSVYNIFFLRGVSAIFHQYYPYLCSGRINLAFKRKKSTLGSQQRERAVQNKSPRARPWNWNSNWRRKC